MKPQCRKRVFSGKRDDMSGHTCGNYAQEGSYFCHLHDPDKPEPEDPRGPAARPARVTATTRTTHSASLDWDPGNGPVVKPPYWNGYGFVTKVRAVVTDSDGRVSVAAWGVVRKKDGTPGIQTWEAVYRVTEALPDDVLAQLLDALDAQRSVTGHPHG